MASMFSQVLALLDKRKIKVLNKDDGTFRFYHVRHFKTLTDCF
jgi:hypothetical protein